MVHFYAKSARQTEYIKAAEEAVKYAVEVVKKNPSHLIADIFYFIKDILFYTIFFGRFCRINYF